MTKTTSSQLACLKEKWTPQFVW